MKRKEKPTTHKMQRRRRDLTVQKQRSPATAHHTSESRMKDEWAGGREKGDFCQVEKRQPSKARDALNVVTLILGSQSSSPLPQHPRLRKASKQHAHTLTHTLR